MRISKALLSGLFFIAAGIGCVVLAMGYRLGTPVAMGPGYFPALVGLLIVVFGMVTVVQALREQGATVLLSISELRPLVLVVSAMVVFAVTIRPLGLVPATCALVCLGRLADRHHSLMETIVMIVVLNAIAVTVFIYGLGLPIRLGPW